VLSVASLAQGPGYYLELANINYYAEGGEPPPTWYGTAAREFGLSGIAVREHVERLCSGFHHDTGEALVRNAGKDSRNPGHDLTFSAPKSVSVAWAIGDEALRKAIAIKHEEAVKQALDFLEANAGFARVGSQGQAVTKAPLLFALFEHGTSRANDPQLHTHALCINLTMHPDGRATAMDSTHLYHWKMATGAMYRAAFARGLQELGFVIEQRRVGASIGFEITAVPKGLVEWFSKRRAEIEQVLNVKAGGLDAASPKYAELVAKETRRTKDTEKPRQELVGEWKDIGLRHGVSASYLHATREPFGHVTREERELRREVVFQRAIDALSDQHAHWNEATLTKSVAEHSIGLLTAHEAQELVSDKLRSGELVNLGRLIVEERGASQTTYIERGEERFTTPEMLRLERQMLQDVERVVRGPANRSPETLIERAIAASPRELDPEQADAVRWLCGGPGIALMSGIAGSGKTTTVQTCHEAWKADGRDVIGCAVAARAAKQLERETGIESHTLCRLLNQLDQGRERLSAKSIVVVDEAGMVGTKDLARLVEHVAKTPGARLVLLGDAEQLQPILAGGPFKYLSGLLGEARLDTIRRQEEKWARDAVRDFKEGRAQEAIDRYEKHGCFHVADSRPQAMAQVIEQWKKDDGIKNPERVFLLASLNCEVKELNLRAQAERIRAGELDPSQKMHVNGFNLHAGDRIQFLRNSTELDVSNGHTGTVLGIEPGRGRLTVRMDDDGREIAVSLKRYMPENIRLGYAGTTHKAQGATIPHVHVLMGGQLTDKHMGYVQASRSKISTHLFTDAATAGEKSKELVRALSRSNQKTMAHEIIELPRRPEPPLSPPRSLTP